MVDTPSNEVASLPQKMMDFNEPSIRTEDNTESPDESSSLVKISEGIEKPEESTILNSSPEKMMTPTAQEPNEARKYSSILDSDSEDDDVSNELFHKQNAQVTLGGSDSDESDTLISKVGKTSKTKRIQKIFNSDSEDEEPFKNISGGKEVSGDGDNENSQDPQLVLKLLEPTDRVRKLIDSESEDENRPSAHSESSSNENDHSTKSGSMERVKSVKKRKGSHRSSKDEAMREIHRETQRLFRESNVSLPYHRPKQRTLQEFLKRKKNLPDLPTSLSTAVKVKMSAKLVEKVVEEKEREADLFYKSSSESDDEKNQNAAVAPIQARGVDLPDSGASDNIENICIGETQKAVKNDSKNCDKNRETIKQGDKDIGVPRKLFDVRIDDSSITNLSLMEGKPIEKGISDTESEQLDLEAVTKESRQSLKIASVPRKLFVTDEEALSKTRSVLDERNVPREKALMLEKMSCELEGNKENLNPGVMNTKASERMEEETEEFELKMSEHFDLKMSESQCRKITNQFVEITETPFIHKKDVSKLNNSEDMIVDSEFQNMITSVRTSNQSEDCINADDNSLNSLVDETPKANYGTNSRDSDNDIELQDIKKTGKNTTQVDHVDGLSILESDNVKLGLKRIGLRPEILKNVPKLVGSPDMMIDLSCVSPKTMTSINKSSATFATQTITSTHLEETDSGFTIVTEVIPYKPTTNVKPFDSALNKPGAKLMRLKEELKQQMVARRTKEWNMKEKERSAVDDDGSGYDTQESEAEDETDAVEEAEESGESEPEEDDVVLKEGKIKNPGLFVDEEAEVSDEDSDEEVENDDKEENDDEEGDDDGEDEDEQDATDDGEEEDDVEDRDEEARQAEDSEVKPRELKRIAKAFEDDDSDDSESNLDSKETKEENNFPRTKTDVDLFETDNNSSDHWLSDTEGDMPAYQPRVEETSQTTPLVSKNSLSIISPITQLTALNTKSESYEPTTIEKENYSPIVPPFSVEKTPIREENCHVSDTEKRTKLLKKLFDDNTEIPSETELLNLCSGQFSGIDHENQEINKLIKNPTEKQPSDAELLVLCSGTFATQATDGVEDRTDEKPQDTNSSLPDDDVATLNEAEKPNPDRNGSRIILSSDDEDELDKLFGNSRKKVKSTGQMKKVKRLNLSDEDSSESEDDIDEDKKIIEYDSEENEIEIGSKTAMKKVASKFVDEEAELSESEWGSADEDEHDLDKLEVEAGDLEEFDQDQVRSQLEKIHMKQILDKDQREVRLLQEMLLEDGELHSDGASRQRKFKWKNIDKLEEGEPNATAVNEDDDVSADANDVENELEWRKSRLEREKFLEQQKANNDIEEDEADSQLLQFGMRALKKLKNKKLPDPDTSVHTMSTKTSVLHHTVADLFATPTSDNKPFALQTAIHRGSFLARGEASLARLSEMTKQNAMSLIGVKKSSKNFIFTRDSPGTNEIVDNAEDTISQDNSEDTDKTRKRKSGTNFTSAISKKRKTDEKNNSQKKISFFS